jgi:prepilin signal peptidase PulO-like enzyme (type II secretory pathway)
MSDLLETLLTVWLLLLANRSFIGELDRRVGRRFALAVLMAIVGAVVSLCISVIAATVARLPGICA